MNQDARHRLEEILDREVEAAHSLAATLAAERLALTGDSPDAVVQKAAPSRSSKRNAAACAQRRKPPASQTPSPHAGAH